MCSGVESGGGSGKRLIRGGLVITAKLPEIVLIVALDIMRRSAGEAIIVGPRGILLRVRGFFASTHRSDHVIIHLVRLLGGIVRIVRILNPEIRQFTRAPEPNGASARVDSNGGAVRRTARPPCA